MFKKKIFVKKFNKSVLSIIERIESFFNNLKVLINQKKNKKIYLKNIDNKIPLYIGLIVFLVLSYFLIPSFYDKNLVKTKLESKILKKYNLEVKINGDLEYGLFPKPHFFIKNIIFFDDGEDVAKSMYSKIYISIKNLHSSKNINIKNLFFKKTEFNINSKNVKFFKKILNSNKSEYELKFRNSNLFYEDYNKDVIFLTEIKKLIFSYNEEFAQELNSNLEIFNIPFKINLKNNLENKNLLVNLNSNKIRLDIQNDFNYDSNRSSGSIDFEFINKSKLFNYVINKNSMSFNSEDNKATGSLDFKPFYLFSDFKFNQIDIAKLLKRDSVFLSLLSSGILNNQNLNAQLNINFDKIKGVNYIEKISLKTFFEEGNIIIKNSAFDWNNAVLINLNEIQLIIEDNKLLFVGSIIFDFEDLDKFYSHYQVQKSSRKKIKEIKLNFLLDIYERKAQIENLKIDGVFNKNLDKFLINFNSKKIDVFNKVLLRNFIKEFFNNYSLG